MGIEVKHREAYCLMTYRCEQCGTEEVLWNSRDGVTPFCIPCAACGASELGAMSHVRFHEDRRASLYVPQPGQRYFIDMTRERARELSNRNADRLVSMGRIPSNDRNRVSDTFFEDYYRDGTAPDIQTAPLAWVEGKPVYKDDPLYHKETGKQYIVSGGDSALSFHNTEVMLSPTLFAWENPTPKPVKRWVNVYADKYGDLLHETKDAADAAVSRHRIDCIEIELPPLGK